MFGKGVRDPVNRVASGDLLVCLRATDCLYEYTTSVCSCYYQTQESASHDVTTMGYSSSFFRLYANFDKPQST